MLILNQRTCAPGTDSVALAYDERKRSRLKVTLASGIEAGIFLERGDHLHGGDKLADEDGSAVVEIHAAPERLIEAVATDALLFARTAYHLGNQHVPVQILPDASQRWPATLPGRPCACRDGVRLGCRVFETEMPFEPGSGAYGHGHPHRSESTDLHDPGHGPHRSLPKIRQFKPG
jgi:urease accessory protein